MSAKVVVLTKVPAAGAVKTRLIPLLGAEGAKRLHEAMVADLQELLASIGVVPEWWVAGDLQDPWVESLQGTVRPQPNGDLGARIAAALAEGGVALGTDSPTIPAEWLEAALHAESDVVLGPSTDGGCWLIGTATDHGHLFEQMQWSVDTVFAELKLRAAKAGLTISALPTGYDIDEPKDIALLCEHLAELPPHVARNTRALLSSPLEPQCPSSTTTSPHP